MTFYVNSRRAALGPRHLTLLPLCRPSTPKLRPLRALSGASLSTEPYIHRYVTPLSVSFVLRAVEERTECDVCVPGLRRGLRALDSAHGAPSSDRPRQLHCYFRVYPYSTPKAFATGNGTP